MPSDAVYIYERELQYTGYRGFRVQQQSEVSHLTDNDIIKLYFDRDERAISETSARYGGYCTSIAYGILGSREDAEECVNDTYLRAWNSIPPHKPGILSVFLGRITRNLSFNRYRKNRAGKRGGGELALILDELDEIVSGDSSAEDQYLRSELANEISAFLAGLSSDKREMFLRRYWYADPVTDIAEHFGCTANSAAVTLSRIRSDLKNYLHTRGYHI